jgi:RNA polymerase sigma-70 factor (ECF subfamily)
MGVDQFSILEFQEHNFFPVRPARSIPPIRTRSSHSFLKYPPKPAIVENGPGCLPAVLHCGPLLGPQRRGLQFDSFDEAYVARLRAADSATERHFVSYFSALIQIKLRSRLPSREAIEDARQETFARFFVALQKGKILQPERLGSFVNSICNNVLREQYRSGKHDTPLDDEDQEKDFPAPGIGMLGAMEAREAEEKVREILDQLPERDRRLLREVFLEERDKDAVCRDFGVDREYLRVLLHRAKQAFKSLYLKNMNEPPAFGAARGF